MTVLILHGIDGFAGKHWQGWLHDELVKCGEKVIMPTLPSPHHPDRKECLTFVQSLVKDEDFSKLILVGHSLGVATALDFIESLQGKHVKALISVSGFFEDYGAELNSYFMAEKEINLKKVKQNCQDFFVLFGDDDPYVPQETLRSFASGLDVEPIIIPKGGHLNTSAGFTTLPEALRVIKSL